MAAAQPDQALQNELVKQLESSFPGLNVTIGHHPRWKRRCITLRWKGFKGLLPEERFRAVIHAIPADYYKQKLSGAVWFELAPGETEEAFMALPRSEDVAAEEPKVVEALLKSDFFARLQKELLPSPTEKCGGGLHSSKTVLKQMGWSPKQIERACLVFIRHHSFCDCEVLLRASLDLKALKKSTAAKKRKKGGADPA